MSRPGLLHRPSSVAAANKTIILVSGANTGIGLAIVKKLAQDSPNNQILLGCRDVHKGEEAVASLGAPTNVNPIQLDITDDASIEHCQLAISQHFGKLDVLVNNAGTAAQHLPKDAPIRERFEYTLNVNVTSTAVLTERLIPLLEKSNNPKIIFVSSNLASMQNTLAGAFNAHVPWYSSSKGAVNSLTVYYASNYPKFKVNAVCPGYRATGLNGIEFTEDRDPKLGSVRVAELVAEGPDGATGTFSRTEGPLPW